jgi:hypothetical protein
MWDAKHIDGCAACFSDTEMQEFSKYMISQNDISAAYDFVKNLPVIECPYDGTEKAQAKGIQAVLAAGNPVLYKPKQAAKDPDKVIYLICDLWSPDEVCRCRILFVMFRDLGWTCSLLETVGDVEAVPLNPTLGVFVAAELKDPRVAGILTTVCIMKHGRVVTILGQKEFDRPDQQWLMNLSEGKVYSQEEVDECRTYGDSITAAHVAMALGRVYSILAMRFHPEENSSILDAQFSRLAMRLGEVLKKDDEKVEGPSPELLRTCTMNTSKSNNSVATDNEKKPLISDGAAGDAVQDRFSPVMWL